MGHNQMVQIGPVANIKCNVLEWENTVVPTKYKDNIPSKPNNTSVRYERC